MEPEQNTHHPIRIHLVLRKHLHLAIGQWKCTIRGEERIVPDQHVEFYCYSIEDAIRSFNINEVKEFKIEGKYI